MNFIKKDIKYIGIIMICIFCSYLTTIATNYAFDSSDVRFDNTGTNLDSVNVQDALDETFHHVTDYNEIKTTIGNGSLTTTSQNIIGAINEVSGNNNSLSDQIATLNSKIIPSESYTGDLNNAPEGVIYTGSGVTNTPANYAYWFVITTKQTTNEQVGSQIAIGRTGDNPPMYFRVKSGGTWTSWYKLATGSQITSLSDQIAKLNYADYTITLTNSSGRTASVTCGLAGYTPIGATFLQNDDLYYLTVTDGIYPNLSIVTGSTQYIQMIGMNKAFDTVGATRNIKVRVMYSRT